VLITVVTLSLLSNLIIRSSHTDDLVVMIAKLVLLCRLHTCFNSLLEFLLVFLPVFMVRKKD